MKEQPLKVMIGIPSNDMLHADFAMSLISLILIASQEGIQIAVINQHSSIIEIGRCEICETAINYGADYLLFLDSDMTFPSDLLIKLIAHKKDIVGCDAMRRRPPFTSVIKGLDNKVLDHEKQKEGLIEVKGISTACLLINLNVFKKITRPYFCVEYSGNKTFLGEDFYFSNKVRNASYKIYCDMGLSKKIGHIGSQIFYIK